MPTQNDPIRLGVNVFTAPANAVIVIAAHGRR
jgi:hypothetical protein